MNNSEHNEYSTDNKDLTIKNLANYFCFSVEVMIEKMMELQICDEFLQPTPNSFIKGYVSLSLEQNKSSTIYYTPKIISYLDYALKNDCDYNVSRIIKKLTDIKDLNTPEYNHDGGHYLIKRYLELIHSIYNTNKHNEQFIVKLYLKLEETNLSYLLEKSKPDSINILSMVIKYSPIQDDLTIVAKKVKLDEILKNKPQSINSNPGVTKI